MSRRAVADGVRGQVRTASQWWSAVTCPKGEQREREAGEQEDRVKGTANNPGGRHGSAVQRGSRSGG